MKSTKKYFNNKLFALSVVLNFLFLLLILTYLFTPSFDWFLIQKSAVRVCQSFPDISSDTKGIKFCEIVDSIK